MTAPRDVYFVGTIPLARGYAVFTTLAEIVGERARRVPDGETGDRQLWVSAQYPILAASPWLEVGAFPQGGVARSTSYEIPLRLRPGVDPGGLKFGELGYARYAITSYGVFRSLQEAGRIPATWRFQVNLPAPMDVMSLVEPAARATVEGPYEQALLAEIDRIQAAIPHERLAITLDAVRGVLEWESPANPYVGVWFADAENGVVERLARLARAVAPDVELGLHLCYGSQDHSHAIEPRNLSACVGLANAVATRLTRRIDYVHMPVPRERADDDYFAPLAGLDRDHVAHLYLGLVHYTDGVAGACRRIGTAMRHRADFGIATECGFGRRPHHQDVRRLIRLHAEIAG